MVQKIAALSALERYLRVTGLTLYKFNFGSVFPLTRFKALFSAVLQILLSAAEGCGCLAEGSRFDYRQIRFLAVFAVYLPFSALVEQQITAV